MAYQISTQRDQLEQKTTELESKTVELNETNTELSQKNDELDSANSQLEQTNDDLEQTNIDLAAKTAEAEENLVFANIQKAEAEKNLVYANQQKIEAEQNLEYANQQKAEAERNLVYANEQKELAEINEASTKKANHELRIKSSDILTTQAELYLNSGDRINAIKAAIEALPVDENDDLPVNVTAEYLLSQAASVYSNSSAIIRNYIETSGYIAGMEYCDNGNKILAYDTSNIIYLIDANSDRVMKTYSVVNDFHIVASSSEIKDVIVEEDYAYILYSGGLACINLIEGSVQWYINGFFFAEMIKTNRLSDLIAVKTFDGFYFINKDGNIVEEFTYSLFSDINFDFGDDINFFLLDDYLAFVDENGCLYICTNHFSGSSQEYLLLLDPHKRTAISYSLNLNNLLHMAELDGNIIISSGLEYEGKIACYSKSDLSIKWETEYSSADHAYLSRIHFNYIFRHSSAELFPGKEIRDVIGVISGENILCIDYKSGEVVASYNTSSEIKGFCYLTVGGFVGLSVEGVLGFSLSVSLMLRFYLFPHEQIEQIAYDGKNRFAFSESKSSGIITYKTASRKKQSVEFINSDYSGSFKLFTENGCGIIAVFARDYKNDIKSIAVYDTNKQEKNAEIILNNDVQCLKFVNADNLVICDEEGIMYLYDIRGRLLDHIDFRGGIADDFQLSYSHISFHNSSSSVLVSKQGDIFICRTSNHTIFIKIIENTLHVEEIIYWPRGADYDLSCFLAETNFGVIAYGEPIVSDNVNGDTEYLHSKIRYYDMNTGFSYVLDGENDFLYNRGEVSNLLISDSGEIIVFLKVDEYIGVYSTKEKLLRKIEIPAGDTIPKFTAISLDEKFLLALCHNGNIIKYSLDDLSISDQIKTYFDMTSMSIRVNFEFIGNNEAIISFNEKVLFVDYGSMKIRAEIDGDYVGFIPLSKKIIISKYNSESERYLLYYYKYLTTEELIESAKHFAGLD